MLDVMTAFVLVEHAGAATAVPPQGPPGYQRILIHPEPGGGLTQAAARHETPYGTVESAWSNHDGRMTLKVRIPPNTRANLRLPGAVLAAVVESGGSLAGAPGVLAVRQEPAAVVVDVGSGNYEFSYPAAVAEQ